MGARKYTDADLAHAVSEGLKMRRCEMCLRDHWNGKPIPIELDHLNGRRDDNRLQNLRILCPNCHAQTPTYRGRNIGAAVHV
jgi:5-methylcytosine-specific restriction endonuclease McrA